MNEEYSPQIGDIVYLIVATNTRSFSELAEFATVRGS